ncbi:MAG: maleylpyruvate isomerase N-terminal domain-containing protein [Acidobacteria bacterium]|nr:maleylpyruvate isomerase N-terminal domain-containing protein [Acidobacteriota bacterium]
MSIAHSLLPEFDHEMAGLRRLLERIPGDRMDFRPHPKSFSLHELANHLAFVPRWATATMETTELEFSSPEVQAMRPTPADSAAGLVKILDEGLPVARERLASASDEAYLVPWSGKNGGKVLFTLPRIAVIRGMVLNHMIHHRAQATVYLRMLDVPVPALYGPSADEA